MAFYNFREPLALFESMGYSTMRRLFLSAVAFSLGISAWAGDPISYAVDSEKDRTEESFIPRYAVAGGYISWASGADFSNGTGSVSQWEAGIQGNAPILTRDNYRPTVGIQYRYNRLSFTGLPLPLSNMDLDLRRVDVPLNFWADL